jgi:hypothetical protein
MIATATTLGTDFAKAFAAKDAARIRELVHPEIDFKALTPNQNWEAAGPDALVEILFGDWLEDTETVESVEQIETDVVVDRERVGYRLRIRDGEGTYLVEQQAYVGTRDGQIDWMRVVCSGYRPI